MNARDNSIFFAACCLALVALLPADGTPEARAADRFLTPGTTDTLSRSFLGPLKSDFITPEQIGLKHEEFTVTNQNGATLRVWRFPADGAKHTILFCMGNQGNISTHLAYTKILLDGGFNVVMFDYQGYGGSSGSASALSLLGDTFAVAEHLTRQLKLSPNDLGAFGVSLGSALAVAVAAKYEFGAVAVEDILLPGKKLDEVAQHLPNDFASQLAVGTLRKVILPQVDPLITVKKLKCPLCIMHGEHDELLPPSGSVSLAQAATVPVRLWLMDDAGHAPETLEIYEGEYAQQVNLFFRQAFADELSEPKLSLSTAASDERWQATVKVECTQPGAYQIALANSDGKCHFMRRVIKDSIELKEVLEFEPQHVSAVLFYQARTASEDQWSPIKTERSRALADYRSFEREFAQDRPLTSQMAIAFGALRPVRYRTAEDLKWLLNNLPPHDRVQADVRPRYARLVASVFAQLPVEQQASHVELVSQLLPYLPDDPYHYHQLENAGFQLQLRDEQLAGMLILLARLRYDQGHVDESRRLLSLAYSVTNQAWLKRERIEGLQPGNDFFRALGM